MNNNCHDNSVTWILLDTFTIKYVIYTANTALSRQFQIYKCIVSCIFNITVRIFVRQIFYGITWFSPQHFRDRNAWIKRLIIILNTEFVLFLITIGNPSSVIRISFRTHLSEISKRYGMVYETNVLFLRPYTKLT